MTSGIRILALLLIVVGAACLILGLTESESFANRFMKEMGGSFLKETKLYIIGGITMIVVGAGLLGSNFFKK